MYSIMRATKSKDQNLRKETSFLTDQHNQTEKYFKYREKGDPKLKVWGSTWTCQFDYGVIFTKQEEHELLNRPYYGLVTDYKADSFA